MYGQKNNTNVLLDSAKTLFKSERTLNSVELDAFDYYKIVKLLEKVIAKAPDNQEARYFLGYTYSRINSRDGRGLIAMQLDLLRKTSEQFEKVIKINPKYIGDFLFLDPYSKLSAEWGSMGMKYWQENKKDSAVWAFKEGKKRGGFGNFIFFLNKLILDNCSKNAILVSSGDNFTISLWYLQIVEGYRTDVSVVDINLLNSVWYPAFLSKSKSVAFDIADEMMDSLEYINWHDSTLVINNFSWVVSPSYYNQYLLRGDRLFLSLLKENKFNREIYCTPGIPQNALVGLSNFLTNKVIVDKLELSATTENFSEFNNSLSSVLKLASQLNLNSTDELRIFDNFRYYLLDRIDSLIQNNEKDKAVLIMDILDKYGSESSLPYQDKDGKEYADSIRKKLTY